MLITKAAVNTYLHLIVFNLFLQIMQNNYNLLITELPRIAEVVERFQPEQRDRVLDLLIDALTQNTGAAPVTTKEVDLKSNVKNRILPPVATHDDEVEYKAVETEASKKLSKLRAKIFEKTTSVSADDIEDDPIKAKLDDLSTEDLSNIVFYQKGRKTPLSDMM